VLFFLVYTYAYRKRTALLPLPPVTKGNVQMSRKPLSTEISPVVQNEVQNVPAQNVPAVIEVQTDYRALVARIVSENPDAAKALALASLFAPTATRATRTRNAVAPTETESERACRCASFSPAQNRGLILTALINALGDKDSVSVTEAELCEATKIPQPQFRSPLSIVMQRLADRTPEGLAKFPLIPQIGYSLAVEGENGQGKIAHFSRNVPNAKSE
jgi:hypothetical protein